MVTEAEPDVNLLLTDYLIVGAGAMGLGFLDELINSSTDMEAIIVDTRSALEYDGDGCPEILVALENFDIQVHCMHRVGLKTQNRFVLAGATPRPQLVCS